MRGTRIVVTSNPQGKFGRGFVKTGQTFYPGMAVQIDPSVALISGVHTYKIYDRAADGDRPLGACWIVTEEFLALVGKTASDSYSAGEMASFYSPMKGEEMNLLLADVAGTGDDHALAEELMIDDGTGKFIATTGSPQTNAAVLLEAITDPTADTLAWAQWSGM